MWLEWRNWHAISLNFHVMEQKCWFADCEGMCDFPQHVVSFWTKGSISFSEVNRKEILLSFYCSTPKITIQRFWAWKSKKKGPTNNSKTPHSQRWTIPKLHIHRDEFIYLWLISRNQVYIHISISISTFITNFCGGYFFIVSEIGLVWRNIVHMDFGEVMGQLIDLASLGISPHKS